MQAAQAKAAPKPAAPAPAAPAQAGSSRWMGSIAAVGWVLAMLAGAAAYFEFKMVDGKVQAALAEQRAVHEQEIAALKADAALKIAEGENKLKKANDEAAANSASMQAELDYAKMPEVPLKTLARSGQVLYVENESDSDFACKVKMFRPIGGVTKEFDFSLAKRAFKDMAAIDDWLFQKGDKIEFVKPGYKPRSVTVQ